MTYLSISYLISIDIKLIINTIGMYVVYFSHENKRRKPNETASLYRFHNLYMYSKLW